MPTPAELRKQFIKAFDRLAHDRERYDVLADFLEMAFCAIRKPTLPEGPAADAIEERYMGFFCSKVRKTTRAGLAAQA